ncbi:unnamed protein product [Ectocarpus sp. CCAP 1310/34]|nr:unnamed protein product [Ectocarpus sp. CCAP 1310/34]
MSSGESLRSSGRSSQRFSEVLSHGPTAIPAREDVDAAISSALAVDDLGFGCQAHSNGEQPSDSRSQPRNIEGADSRPPYTGPMAGPARVPNAATATTTIPVQHSAGVGVGVGVGVHGGGGGLLPRANGVGAGVAGNSSNGGAGGFGLLDWALWPLWGTIDALKWAGGTVNEVAVAPVIRMASPWGLVGSVLTTVKAFTPQRARDLARVVGNFGLNAAGLVQTPAGVELLRSSGRATGSLSTAVSSPAGRQFLLESATGLVKLAEALDTPEAKNFIQQGAVVAARGMDALASRHTKIFVKDLADVIVRLVELANSREATILAAEFTVNVEHALEMEHMAGIARRAAANAAAGATADANFGLAAGDAHAPPAGGDRTEPNLGPAEDVVGPTVEEPEVNGGPVCAAGGEQTLDDLVREARAERAHRESGRAGGPRSAGHERGGSDGSVLAGGGPEGCCPSRSGEGRPSSNDPADADHRTVVTPVIRQADLAGDTPLRTFLGAAGGTAPVAPPPGDTSRSAPSSPRGWPAHAAAAAAAAAAAGAVPALPTLGGQCAGNRERASTVTGAGDDGVGGDTAEEACEMTFGAGFTAGCRSGGENDGTESVLSGARPPAVEYQRDGNARLPRFTSEHFESVLRGQPLGLELQLEAPNEDSLDDTVARAASSRVPLEGASPPSPRVDAGKAPGNAVQETAGQGAPPGEGEGEGVSVPSTAGAQGWKQAAFACLLLFFAGDGLRHRWKAGFRGEKTAHENASMPPPPPTPGPPKPGSLATDGRNSVFGVTFLPPTCKDPVSGATMAVWVAPSGPCLSPASVSGGGAGSTEGLLGGGGEPACSASFRLCSAAEVGARGGVEQDATGPPDSCGFEGTRV